MTATKPLPLLALSLIAGASAGFLVALLAPRSEARAEPREPAPASAAQDTAATLLTELSRRADELEARLTAQELAPRASSRRSALGGVDAAVDRWMRAHAPESAGDENGEDADAVELAVDRILSVSSASQLDAGFWKKLAASGELPEVLARMEELVDHSPYDPSLRVKLAQALVQSSFQRGAGPERERALDRAEEEYGAALDLDGRIWEARFGKAITLSIRPSFLGKSNQAIEELETLARQQEQGPPKPHFAETYYYLGNLYAQLGETDKALAAWGRGGELFPGDGRFAHQIETERRVRGGGE